MPRENVQPVDQYSMERPLLLTFSQVGELVGQSRTTVYKLVREGRLPVVRLGRSSRIPRAAVEQFVLELIAEVS